MFELIFMWFLVIILVFSFFRFTLVKQQIRKIKIKKKTIETFPILAIYNPFLWPFQYDPTSNKGFTNFLNHTKKFLLFFAFLC